MEKKGFNSTISVIVATVSFLGLICCAVACFTLYQALRIQRHEASEAGAQLSSLDEALKIQQSDLSKTQEQLESATQKIAAVQQQNEALSQKLAALQSKSPGNQPVAQMNFQPFQFQLHGPDADTPAPDSVEGRLRSEGKAWERAQGQPVPGEYVQDILTSRSDQPKGRGSIGKVLSVGANDNDPPCATVDFGRGCVEGIMFSELAPVRFVSSEIR